MKELDTSRDPVERAEEIIATHFHGLFDDFLRQRGATRPLPSDDAAIYNLANAAVRRYHDLTIRDPSLPQLSKVQLWEISQRLYLTHGSLGPLGDLLTMEGVEDIHIHGARGGCLVFSDHREELPIRFDSEDALVEIVRHYAEQAGKHFDPANPLVTVTLKDGSRLNAVLPPVSKPIVVTVRRQQLMRFLSVATLVEEGALPPQAVPVLEAAMLARLNILISGGTGAGKTTLARVLALAISDDERTCVIETETELWLHDLRERDTFSLEAREANVEGAGRITLRHLFQHAALRQRPERIIVGEVRGDEAMDMLHAMTSGHDGSLTTIHASGTRAALNRLEALAMLSDPNLSPRVVRQMIGMGIDLIIHLAGFRRDADRIRRVASMAWVDDNAEDPEGRPGVYEFCRYRISNDDWIIGDEWGIHPPQKVGEKLHLAGLDVQELRANIRRGGS